MRRLHPILTVIGFRLRANAPEGQKRFPISNRQKTCALCGTDAPEVFQQKVVGKYLVSYYRCPTCDLIQTDEPVWFREFPWTRIAPLDTGAVRRSIGCADLVAAVMGLLEMDPDAPCYDLGGGNGLFVRLMRDRGYNFLWHDRYEPNIHAKGFEADPNGTYDCVTCFEVFEHLPNVDEVLSGIFEKDHQVIVVSTCLHNGDGPGWWYYFPEIGGHVSFYSKRTMAYLGQRYGYTVVTSPAYTLFLKRPVSDRTRRLLTRMLSDSRYVSLVSRALPTVPTLINSDCQRLSPEILPHLPSVPVTPRQRPVVRNTGRLELLALLPNRRPFSWALRLL